MYNIEILVVSNRVIEGNVSYQESFSDCKTIIRSRSYRDFKSQKYIQLHYAHELKSQFPENHL